MTVYFFAEYSETPEVWRSVPGMPGTVIKNGYTKDIQDEGHCQKLESIGGVVSEGKPKKIKTKIVKQKGDKPNG